MADHRAPRMARLRNIGRASAVVTGGVLALSGIAAGTASAHEGYDEADEPTTETTTEATAEDPGFLPTSPVDGVANHWMTYHYQTRSATSTSTSRWSRKCSARAVAK